MEDEGLVACGIDDFACVIDALGGVAEHAGGDEREVFGGGWHFCLDHSADGSGSAGEDGACDAVETCDIGDAGDHGDVFFPDVVGGIAAGEGGDHDLGESEGEGAHGCGGDGCAAASAEGDDAVDFSFGGELCD